MKFESFCASENKLIALNKIKSKLYGFNIDKILMKNSFSEFEFEIKVNDITSFGFSSDLKCVFTIENRRLLQFYKCEETTKKLAEIPLYSDTGCVMCTKDFLVLSMKDRRIISYFIYDLNKPNESYEQIRQLAHR